MNPPSVPSELPATPSDLPVEFGPDDAVALTPEGAQALARYPEECCLCREVLAKGDSFYRITLGMDEAPSFAGLPSAGEFCEDTSELVVCQGCHPRASEAFDRLVRTFWELRKPDPVPEPTTEVTAS